MKLFTYEFVLADFNFVKNFEINLQWQLELLFKKYREQAFKLKTTNFNENLSKSLSLALNDYEWERSYCATPSPEQEDFIDLIKRQTPEGKTFKAKPKQFKSFVSAEEILRSFVQDINSEADVKNIFTCKTNGSRFGLKVKSFSYAENVINTWVMIAVIF